VTAAAYRSRIAREANSQDKEDRTMGMLDGKIAIITGATSGIGERTAELFVAEGARLFHRPAQSPRRGDRQKARRQR